MSARPWMSFYVADYLADTTHLTTIEHGAYLLLIFAYWQGGAPLPDDDPRLARLARMSLKDWTKLRPTLAELFDVAGGAWKHKRVDRELAEADEKYQRRALAGRKGGERKALAMAQQSSGNDVALLEQCQGNAEAMLYQLQPQSQREEESPVPPLPDEAFERAWDAFPTQRKGSREKASAAWKAAKRRDPEFNPDAIVGIVQRYALSDEVGRGYAKGMAAWLNDDRWTVDYGGSPGTPKTNGAADPEVPPAMYIPIVQRANEKAVRIYERHRSTDEERDAASKAMTALFRAARAGAAEAEATARAYLGDEA